MTDLSTIRASSAPEAERCPASVRGGTLRIDPIHDGSLVGTACHELLDQVVTQDITSGVGVLDVDAVAKRLGIAAEELAPLVHYGIDAWRTLRQGMPSPMAEVYIRAPLTPDVTLTGHIDVLSVSEPQRRAWIVDWKSGRIDRSYHAQLMSYAWLVFAEYPVLEELVASIVWLREAQIESYAVRRADVMKWRAAFVEDVVEWDGTYHPGAHCGHCPRSHECPALAALARRDVALFGSPDVAATIQRGLVDLTAAQIVELRRKAKMLEVFLDSFDKSVRFAVESRGPLDSGDGSELRFVEEPRREIDPLKAWPAITARLTDEELAESLKISVTRLEKTIAQKAGRGKGAAAVRALGAELDLAGAISRAPIRKLSIVRK